MAAGPRVCVGLPSSPVPGVSLWVFFACGFGSDRVLVDFGYLLPLGAQLAVAFKFDGQGRLARRGSAFRLGPSLKQTAFRHSRRPGRYIFVRSRAHHESCVPRRPQIMEFETTVDSNHITEIYLLPGWSNIQLVGVNNFHSLAV